MIASPNTHSLNPQTKVYRRSYPEEIYASYADNVSPSLFPSQPVEEILCIFAKANSLPFTPEHPSADVYGEQPLLPLHAVR